MPFSFYPRLLAVALSALCLPASGLAQTRYVITKILDDQTPRPDGKGTFYIGTPQAFPALDGGTIVFQDITNSDNSLWTANVSGGGFVKIADFQTPVPGAVGNFTKFNDQTARAGDGLVFFEGLDSNTSGTTHGGLYSAPVGGGAINRIIDYNTPAPGATGAFIQSNANNQITAGFNDGDFDYEAGVIAFHGLTDSNGDGVYAVHFDGTGLVRLADKTTLGTPPPFPVGQYYTARLHDHTTVFYGGTVFGGYGIFSSPETGGLDSPVLLATPTTSLPGGQSPEMSTVYFTGFSQFDHQTGNFVFAAHDGSGINGLYTLPSDGLGSGVISKVVDNQTPLPGSAVPASYFDGTQFSADGGQVAFVTATNESANQFTALYVANADGTITRVIGENDVLDGISLAAITMGAHALSDGRIVFGAGSIFQGHDGNPRYGGMFVATPVTTPHAPFFNGETALNSGVYYLQLPGGAPFGYYSYLSDDHYIYHFDLGFEYVFDANDFVGGAYLYDFKSGGFFYTIPSFGFPYLYDFSLESAVYYFPDPNNPGRYNTDGVRFFYVFNTGQIISK